MPPAASSMLVPAELRLHSKIMRRMTDTQVSTYVADRISPSSLQSYSDPIDRTVAIKPIASTSEI